ncbi:unnamed protein product [Citrullus colocynthis]|uniref:Uncharacterized protein n=1 Tax=Citrullus colocynthis TaxID=252529 RepID=A0ABP0Z5W5_9ROSI
MYSTNKHVTYYSTNKHITDSGPVKKEGVNVYMMKWDSDHGLMIINHYDHRGKINVKDISLRNSVACLGMFCKIVVCSLAPNLFIGASLLDAVIVISSKMVQDQSQFHED